MSVMGAGCFLCGDMRHAVNFGVCASSWVSRLLDSHFRVTSVAFQWARSVAAACAFCRVCYPCGNWLRGVLRAPPGGVSLPMDLFVRHCLDPSCVMGIRLFRRLFSVVTVGCMYTPLLPEPVAAIVDGCGGDPQNLLHSWWIYNGSPVVLHDRKIAKLVRRMLHGRALAEGPLGV
jgi:hypothetical protein